MACPHLSYRRESDDQSFERERAYCTVADRFVQPMRADICTERYGLDPADDCAIYRADAGLAWNESADELTDDVDESADGSRSSTNGSRDDIDESADGSRSSTNGSRDVMDESGGAANDGETVADETTGRGEEPTDSDKDEQ